ncbi:hypothetical protein [Snodgrassella gandavensis]|nr:hypothetical protein [Snodgrassella gandavensis]
MNKRIIVGRQSQRQVLKNHDDDAATDGITAIWRNLSSWWHFRA